jgi:hypothetical protein
MMNGEFFFLIFWEYIFNFAVLQGAWKPKVVNKEGKSFDGFKSVVSGTAVHFLLSLMKLHTNPSIDRCAFSCSFFIF